MARSLLRGRLPIAAAVIVSMASFDATAAPPAPQGDAAYWDAWHKSLVELREGKWDEAIATLDAADKLTRGDGRLLLTRGIVKTLKADYAGARSDLVRVRLQGTREPELWQNVIDCMTNEATGGRGVQVPRSLQRPGQPSASFSGVPGHLVQGGKDYPTSYGSYVVYDMAWPHYLKIAEGKPLDAELMQRIKRQAGRWYANRMLATADLSSRSYAHAQSLVKAGQLREAREILDFARAPYPFDADMAALSGLIWLAAGRAESARADYTIALTYDTSLASAYAGRAKAAAMLGDARRAEADLAAAKAKGYDTASLEAAVKQTLATAQASGDPAALLTEMDAAAAEGATVEQLAPAALRLHRAAANGRLRYDEVYQDTLRRHEDAIRADPKNTAAMCDLSQYLIDEADNRGERVEPRRGRVAYRWQHTREMELGRAMFYADKALAVDPSSARALVLKATALGELGRDNEAARLVEQAMRLAGGGDAQAVRLLAEFRRRQIARMLMQASALRTPTFTSSSHDEQRYDGVYRVTVTTRHDPSGADLAQAAALEAAAKQLMAQTRSLMESAIRATGGTLEGYLLASAYEDWFGSRDKALGLLREAVAKYPKSLRAHDALVAYLRFAGRRDESLEAEAVALMLVHPSCGPLLTRAWMNLDRGGFGPLVEILARARQLDPTDVRATIYAAEAERDLQDKQKAAALYTVAAALETARLGLDEQGEAKTWPRRADHLAALMQTRIMLARAAASFKQDDAQITHYEAAMKLAERYPPDGRQTPMFGAVFLAEGANAVPLPPTPNGARIASTAMLEAGKWYQAHNRPADAQRCFEASKNVGVHPRNDPFPGSGTPRPNIGTGRPGDDNFSDQPGAPAGEAAIELAKTEIARKNYQKAFELLQQAAQQPDLPQSKRREINDLTLQIIRHLP